MKKVLRLHSGDSVLRLSLSRVIPRGSAHSGFIAPLLLLLIGLLIGGGGVYFLTKSKSQSQTTATIAPPSPIADETVYSDEGIASWKTYENKELGFSFKHPTGEKMETDINSSENNRYLHFILYEALEAPSPIFTVSVFTDKIEKGDNLYKKYLEAKKLTTLKNGGIIKAPELENELLIEECKNMIKISQEDIVNAKLHRFERENAICGLNQWAIYEHRNSFFVVKKYITTTEEFNQILSTFKFTQ